MTTVKKTSKLCIVGSLWGESTGGRWMPLTAQMTSNVENVSMSWCHHGKTLKLDYIIYSFAIPYLNWFYWVYFQNLNSIKFISSHICVSKLCNNWFVVKPLSEPVLSYCYLNPWNKFQLKFELWYDKIVPIVMQENASENVVCKIEAILPQCFFKKRSMACWWVFASGRLLQSPSMVTVS